MMSSKSILFEGIIVDVLSRIHDSFLCLLCSKVLENPHQAPCGCRFCFNCINDYLKDGLLTCPGQSEDCLGIQLNINNDLKPDILAKREINKLIVKCPSYKCNNECQLRDLKDHVEICALSTTICTVCGESVVRKELLNHEGNECRESIVHCEYCNETMKRKYLSDNSQTIEQSNIFSQYTDHRMVCKSQIVPCPYRFIGCNLNNATFITISKHLVEKGIYHAELILKHMDNINNEVTHLSNETASVKNEVTAKLDEFCAQRIIEIENQDEEINHLNDAVNELKESNETMLPQLQNSIRMECKNAVERVNATQGLVISEVNNKIKVLNKDIKALKLNNFKTLSNKIDKICLENDYLKETVIELQQRVKILDESHKIKNENIRLDWIIEDFHLKHNEFSPDFYTHPMGYKMRLGIEKKVKGYLSIYAYLKRGDYDDYLSWPFRRKVIIKILDQENMGRDEEGSLSFNSGSGDVCNRQFSNEGSRTGLNTFISYTDLKENKFLLRNQTLWIQCIVDELD